MNAQELLQEISDYCRRTGLAESTFGRRAVNDGKLASRLRHGGRITTETLDRIRSFMAEPHRDAARARHHRSRPRGAARRTAAGAAAEAGAEAAPTATIRSAISASSTTGRNICCSSTPAAKSG